MDGPAIEKEVWVWVWLPDQLMPVLAGVLKSDSTTGSFQYARAYLDDPNSIALDPVDLPLRSGKVFKESRFDGLFGVFRDSGPDSWGQAVLEHEHGRALSEIESLELAPGDGVGAIAIGDIRRKAGFKPCSLADLSRAASCLEPVRDISPAGIPPAIRQAFSPNTSLGGARPKLTMEHDGHLWIAKFPDKGDPASLPGREHAMLELGRLCGINACESRVASLGAGKTVLLVKRFDRHPVPGGHARKAYASAHTMLRIAVSKDPREQRRRSYVNFAHEIQRWAGSGDKGRVEGQRRELWRRIVFNGLVNNADDHPRNHGLLLDGGRWGLSPAFDVVPSAFEKPWPVLSMPFLPRGQGMVATPENLTEAGRYFGYGNDEARSALESMAGIVAKGWQAALRQAGLPTLEIDRMAPAFRLAERISNPGESTQDPGQETEGLGFR